MKENRDSSEYDMFSRFSFDQLQTQHEKLTSPGHIVSIQPFNGLDRYNPSNAIKHNNEWYHAVREEPRDDEFNYQTRFFKEVNPYLWHLDFSIPALPLQDPFITKIYGEIVVGGVQAFKPEIFTTVFYKGPSIDKLEEFAHGPINQKDIRLSETQDGRVAILTRPLGKIGFDVIPSLDFLNEGTILRTPLLHKQPRNNEWWGSNDAELLPNGDIGVIGHLAKIDQYGQNYAPIAFTISPITRRVSNLKILVTRSEFPYTEAKKSNLKNVVFPAGIRRREGRTLLYTGLSDVAIGVIEISDPFKQNKVVNFEQTKPHLDDYIIK